MSLERMRWSMVSSCDGGTSAATITCLLESTNELKCGRILLHGLALQELEVHQSDTSTDWNWSLKEIVSRFSAPDETVHEALGSQEQNFAFGMNVANAVADGVQQMGFAKARGGMNKQRIEGDGCAMGGIGDAASCSMGQLIGSSHHETVKGLGGIERSVALALLQKWCPADAPMLIVQGLFDGPLAFQRAAE
jgi:hypothetical protein